MPRPILVLFAALVLALSLSPGAARAHCDQGGSHQHNEAGR